LKQEEIQYDVLHPSYKTLYDLVGEDNMVKIYREFRGTQLELPMKLYDRNELKEYLGKISVDKPDVKKLSHTYGYSQRWIKKALGK